jgi:hypothetical protein
MGKIYKNAEVVLMWLGDQRTYTGHAVPIFRRLAGNLPTLNFKPGLNETNYAPYAEEQVAKSATKNWIGATQKNASWAGVIDWLSKTYFDRLWVIQEVVLSSKAVVICGDYRLEWKCFFDAIMCATVLDLIRLDRGFDIKSLQRSRNITVLG